MKHCIKCKLAIDKEKERYVKVEDNKGKKNIKTIYFHKECWHEMMTGKAKHEKILNKGMKMINFLGKKAGFEEEVTI